MSEPPGGLGTSSSVLPHAVKLSEHWIFGLFLCLGGSSVIFVALCVYSDRRTTHMSTAELVVALTVGSAAVLSSMRIRQRAHALAATRAAAVVSGPTWADGPGRTAASERQLAQPIVVAERQPRIRAVRNTLVLGILAACYPLTEHAAVSIKAAIEAIVAFAVAAGCVRAWRMTLRIGANGILVRNYFRSYWIGLPDVRCLSDGSAGRGEGPRAWALNIVLYRGRVVTATATMAPRSHGQSRVLAAVTTGARYFGIHDAVTGKAPQPRPLIRWPLREQ